MKTKILNLVLFLFLLNSVAAQESKTVRFFGVDYSAVNVLYADETPEQFISAFYKTNILMLSEADKYDVSKFMQVNVVECEINYANKRLDELNKRDFTDLNSEEIEIESVIAAYPQVEGDVLIFIARELNKTTNIGTYNAVIFNGTTKDIVSNTLISGKAKGFGLRNYWAGSLYNAMKSYSKVRK